VGFHLIAYMCFVGFLWCIHFDGYTVKSCNTAFLCFIYFVFSAYDEFSSFQSQDYITEQTSGQTFSGHGLLSLFIFTMAR
jgi:hypothetical protein